MNKCFKLETGKLEKYKYCPKSLSIFRMIY